jgi:hypothetical protein
MFQTVLDYFASTKPVDSGIYGMLKSIMKGLNELVGEFVEVNGYMVRDLLEVVYRALGLGTNLFKVVSIALKLLLKVCRNPKIVALIAAALLVLRVLTPPPPQFMVKSIDAGHIVHDVVRPAVNSGPQYEVFDIRRVLPNFEGLKLWESTLITKIDNFHIARNYGNGDVEDYRVVSDQCCDYISEARLARVTMVKTVNFVTRECVSFIDWGLYLDLIKAYPRFSKYEDSTLIDFMRRHQKINIPDWIHEDVMMGVLDLYRHQQFLARVFPVPSV